MKPSMFGDSGLCKTHKRRTIGGMENTQQQFQLSTCQVFPVQQRSSDWSMRDGQSLQKWKVKSCGTELEYEPNYNDYETDHADCPTLPTELIYARKKQ